ncbi:hypothetical protein CDD83_751 [Cordyceps sp. RAO-2017]|nr:hypothetical protein CDD83_751 [Cordyceps sp. RAO-2017]
MVVEANLFEACPAVPVAAGKLAVRPYARPPVRQAADRQSPFVQVTPPPRPRLFDKAQGVRIGACVSGLNLWDRVGPQRAQVTCSSPIGAWRAFLFGPQSALRAWPAWLISQALLTVPLRRADRGCRSGGSTYSIRHSLFTNSKCSAGPGLKNTTLADDSQPDGRAGEQADRDAVTLLRYSRTAVSSSARQPMKRSVCCSL